MDTKDRSMALKFKYLFVLTAELFNKIGGLIEQFPSLMPKDADISIVISSI